MSDQTVGEVFYGINADTKTAAYYIIGHINELDVSGIKSKLSRLNEEELLVVRFMVNEAVKRIFE